LGGSLHLLGQLTYRVAATGGWPGLSALFYGEDDAAEILTGLRVDTASLGTEDRRTVRLEERITSLYEEFRTPLYRYLLSLGLVTQDVEEIVQDTFLRLYQHLHGGGAEENLRAWLYRVAHNLSVNSRKSRSRLTEISPEFWEHLSQSISDVALGPEEQFLHKERMARVQKTLGELSWLQRECIHLRVEGFRYREIAEVLGVSGATVSSSLRNAIARLTKEYA
jgi:RNA polymerase sigma-70 factor, ECF subfamily